jgi:hypothetical protein
MHAQLGSMATESCPCKNVKLQTEGHHLHRATPGQMQESQETHHPVSPHTPFKAEIRSYYPLEGSYTHKYQRRTPSACPHHPRWYAIKPRKQKQPPGDDHKRNGADDLRSLHAERLLERRNRGFDSRAILGSTDRIFAVLKHLVNAGVLEARKHYCSHSFLCPALFPKVDAKPI